MAKFIIVRDYSMAGTPVGGVGKILPTQLKKGEIVEGRIVINAMTKVKTVHFRRGQYNYQLPLGEFATRGGGITVLQPYTEKRTAPDTETEQAADDEMVMDFRGEGWRKYATPKNLLIGGLSVLTIILGFKYFKNR